MEDVVLARVHAVLGGHHDRRVLQSNTTQYMRHGTHSKSLAKLTSFAFDSASRLASPSLVYGSRLITSGKSKRLFSFSCWNVSKLSSKRLRCMIMVLDSAPKQTRFVRSVCNDTEREG